MFPGIAQASFGNTIVDTQAFHTIDDLDIDSDVYIEFGQILGETLKFERIPQRFNFSNDVHISGDVSWDGIASGPDLNATGTFEGAGLTDCDDGTNSKLLWDDLTKKFSCGTDQSGGGGGSDTLQDIYDNDANGGDAVIQLNATDDSIVIENPTSGSSSPYLLRLLQEDSGSSGVIEIELGEDEEAIRLEDATNADSVGIFVGSGTPESNVSAQLGSAYFDHAIGRLFVKASGDGTNTGWQQLSTSGGGGGGLTSYFDAYDNAGGQTLNTAKTVNIDTVRHSDSNYSLSVDTVTINGDGDYEIVFSGTSDKTNNTRSGARFWLEKDTGAGFAEVDGSRCWAYNRMSSDGENTCTRTMILSLVDGDKVRLRAQAQDGNSGTITKADASSITIKQLD